MAISETLKKTIGGTELLKMGNIGRCELVKGEIIHMSPSGGRHGELTVELGGLLRAHVKPQKIGKVYGSETGFYIQKDPDTVRAPDVMFVSNERVAQISDPVKFLDVAPDLAVEVLSPNDTWTEVEKKVAEYIQAGVLLIWIIDPEQNNITVYRSNGERSRLSETDHLSGENVLPDFSVSISEIFD